MTSTYGLVTVQAQRDMSIDISNWNLCFVSMTGRGESSLINALLGVRKGEKGESRCLQKVLRAKCQMLHMLLCMACLMSFARCIFTIHSLA